MACSAGGDEQKMMLIVRSCCCVDLFLLHTSLIDIRSGSPLQLSRLTKKVTDGEWSHTKFPPFFPPICLLQIN